MSRCDEYLTIGDVAGIVGVSVMTIRSWEQRYGWPRPDRSRCAHRRYAAEDEAAFRAVALLRRTMNTGRAIGTLLALLAEQRDGAEPMHLCVSEGFPESEPMH